MLLWSYKKEKKGFRLYANTEPINFTVLFPFKMTMNDDDIIIYWNENKIKKLVDGLNNGQIPLKFKKITTDGIEFCTKIPKGYY